MNSGNNNTSNKFLLYVIFIAVKILRSFCFAQLISINWRKNVRIGSIPSFFTKIHSEIQ